MSKKRNQLQTLKSYVPIFKEFYLSPDDKYEFMIDSIIMDGEHHPRGYNFMGKGSQNANRAGLTYTGKTGTKYYWLARDKHDRVSLEHDLLYFDDRNLIKEMSDARWLEAAETAKIPDSARFTASQMIKLMREARKAGVVLNLGFQGIVARDAIKSFMALGRNWYEAGKELIYGIPPYMAIVRSMIDDPEGFAGRLDLERKAYATLTQGERKMRLPVRQFMGNVNGALKATEVLARGGTIEEAKRSARGAYIASGRVGTRIDTEGLKRIYNAYFKRGALTTGGAVFMYLLWSILATGNPFSAPYNKIKEVVNTAKEIVNKQQTYDEVKARVDKVTSAYDEYMDIVGYYDDNDVFRVYDNLSIQDQNKGKRAYIKYVREFNKYVNFMNNYQGSNYETAKLDPSKLDMVVNMNQKDQAVIYPGQADIPEIEENIKNLDNNIMQAPKAWTRPGGTADADLREEQRLQAEKMERARKRKEKRRQRLEEGMKKTRDEYAREEFERQKTQEEREELRKKRQVEIKKFNEALQKLPFEKQLEYIHDNWELYLRSPTYSPIDQAFRTSMLLLHEFKKAYPNAFTAPESLKGAVKKTAELFESLNDKYEYFYKVWIKKYPELDLLLSYYSPLHVANKAIFKGVQTVESLLKRYDKYRGILDTENNVVDSIEDMPKTPKKQPKIPAMDLLQEFASELGININTATIGELMDMWEEYGKGKPESVMPKFYDVPRATRLQKMKYLYRTGIDKADLVQMSLPQLTKLYRERYGQLGLKMIAPPPSQEVIKTLSASPSPTPSLTPSITTTPSPTTQAPTTRPNLQEELRKRAKGGMTDEEIDKMKRAQKTTQTPFDPTKVTIPPTSLSVEQMKRNLIEKNFSTKRALDKLTDSAIRDLHFYAFGDVAPVVAEPQGFKVEQVEDVVEPVEEEKVEMVKQPVVVPGVDRFTQGVVKTKNSLEPYQNFISKKRATEVIPSQEEQLRSLTNWEMFQIPLDLNSQGVNLSEEMIKQDNKMLQGSTPNDWYDFTRRQYQPVTTFMHGNMDAFKMNVMVASMTPIKEEITLDKYTTNDDVFKDVTENSDFKHQYEAEINGSMMNSPYNNAQTAQTLVGTEKGGVYGDLKKNLNLFLVP